MCYQLARDLLPLIFVLWNQGLLFLWTIFNKSFLLWIWFNFENILYYGLIVFFRFPFESDFSPLINNRLLITKSHRNLIVYIFDTWSSRKKNNRSLLLSCAFEQQHIYSLFTSSFSNNEGKLTETGSDSCVENIQNKHLCWRFFENNFFSMRNLFSHSKATKLGELVSRS